MEFCNRLIVDKFYPSKLLVRFILFHLYSCISDYLHVLSCYCK